MKHQRFIGVSHHRKTLMKPLDIVSNTLFLNENLRNIQQKPQLIQGLPIEFDHIVSGFGFKELSPKVKQKNNLQLSNRLHTKQYTQEMKPQDMKNINLSPLIRVRRCSVEKSELQSTFIHQERKRAFSFAENRCLSPDQKRRPRVQLFRNLYNKSDI